MPKNSTEIRSLARSHTRTALNALVGIIKNGKSESARIAAAAALFDRGWGRPGQAKIGDIEVSPVRDEDPQA
jgi:hypothetical protein